MIPTHFSRRLVLPAAVTYGVFLLCVPKAAAAGFAKGLALCAESVLPALFPFFVVSSLIVHAPGNHLLAKPLVPLTRICGLKTKEAPLILLLSWVGGYAVCARLIGEALEQKAISRQEARLLLVLGCCSSPGFVIGCIGGLMLGNLQLGVLLYFLQISANLLSAAVLWPRLRLAPGAALSPLPADLRPISLPVAISEAMDSCLTVCGCVLFFRVAASSLAAVFPLTGLPFAGVCALLEITSGCHAFAQLGGAASLYGICICLSCLGASVLTQIRQLAGQKLSLGLFTVSRLCNALFLCGEIRLCTAFLPGTAPAFTSLSERVIISSRLPWDSAFLLFCLLCAVLYKLCGKNYNVKCLVGLNKGKDAKNVQEETVRN